jgi:hypothetical protein
MFTISNVVWAKQIFSWAEHDIFSGKAVIVKSSARNMALLNSMV